MYHDQSINQSYCVGVKVHFRSAEVAYSYAPTLTWVLVVMCDGHQMKVMSLTEAAV